MYKYMYLYYYMLSYDISYCISWHPLLNDGKVTSDVFFTEKHVAHAEGRMNGDIRVTREAWIWAVFVTMVKHQASRFSIDVPVVRRPFFFVLDVGSPKAGYGSVLEVIVEALGHEFY